MKFSGNPAQKMTYYRFAKMAEKKGVVDFRIDRIASEYTHDYYEYLQTTKEEKEWAYKRGFASYKIKWYGLTENNFESYISDFTFYHKDNYMNREFEFWFEHKLNTYYLLLPFKDSIPKHYWFISKQNIMPLEIVDKRNGTINSIVSLVKEKSLAAKAARGGHGVGFYKLEYKNDIFLVNGEKKNKEEFTQFLLKLDDYIITDYVFPHTKFIKQCGEGTFAVIRIITVYDEKDGPQLTEAIIRLGCKAAGVVTDYVGTIYCGIRLEDGTTFKPLIRESEYEYTECTNHPDTGEALENNKIPNWDKLVQLTKQISGYLPMTPYLVMDIIPTQEGFSVLEINSHGQPIRMEPYYPFLDNPYNRKVFNIND